MLYKTAFCPYRISPLGAHVDHQGGLVTGLALDKGVHFEYAPDPEGMVEVRSRNFAGVQRFHVANVPFPKVGDWADHLRGAVFVLQEEYKLTVGLKGILSGDLPSGGISSSAAVIIVFMKAICELNGISLSPQELILLAQKAENFYVGVNCGTLDQSCEVLCKKDGLLFLDTRTSEYKIIPTSGEMPPFAIGIFFSGLERSLANSKYNLRVDECKSAAYSMLAFDEQDYGTYSETRLCDVSEATYEVHKEKLPELWRKRAEHYYSENRRVLSGVEAWQKGDLKMFGSLMFESGASSIHNYECGCEELIRLYEILRETDGVYGARFSGAGFKGCCVALLDPEKVPAISERVEQAYLEAFPSLKGKYQFFRCETADGVGGI